VIPCFACGQQSTKLGPVKAELVVQLLYGKLIAHTTVGIPSPASLEDIAPYLSSGLLKRINSARQCGQDWYRGHKSSSIKPPFAWLEAGLFSGANERTGPQSFHIERTEKRSDGSIRVLLSLTGGLPPDRPWTWSVAAILIRQKGSYVVDDVTYLADKDLLREYRLSDVLSSGCSGSRWVGFGGLRNGQ